MNIQQLDLNLLRVFQTLYIEQNMTRTGEVLHITPSAVSHAVRRLREALDDPLFKRSQNKMLPTPACQRMAPEIIETLNKLQQLLQEWGEFDPLQSTHNFRVGMHEALEASVIPKLSNKLDQLAPSISFSSIKITRSNMVRDLASGHFDIVLDAKLPTKAPIHEQKLFANSFVVMVNKNHPLAKKLDRKSYLEATHINVSSRPNGMSVVDSMFDAKGLQRSSKVRCQNYYAATQAVKYSDKLLTLPKVLAEQFLDDDMLLVELPFSIPSFAMHAYWHQNTDQDPAHVWFREVIIELISGIQSTQ